MRFPLGRPGGETGAPTLPERVHPQPAGNGVDGVVPTHVFDKQQHLRFGVAQTEHGAGVHRAGRLVGAFFQPDGVDQAVELALGDAGIGRQFELIDLVHEPAEHAALTAARGDHTVRCFCFNVVNAAARAHGRRTDLPVHGDRLDLTDVADQALVAQVTQHQQLGVRAQGHQGDQFTLVHIDRQRTFGRNRHVLALAVFIDHLDLAGQRGAGAGQRWQGGCVHGGQGHAARLQQKSRPLAGSAFKGI